MASKHFQFPLSASPTEALVREAFLQNDLTVAELHVNALEQLGIESNTAAMDLQAAEHFLAEHQEEEQEIVPAVLDLWEATHTWREMAIDRHPDLTDAERIVRLEKLSDEHDWDGEEMVHYNMMMGCLAELSDDQVEEILTNLPTSQLLGSQVELEDVRKWAGRQADYGAGIIRGAWIHDLFQGPLGIESALPAADTESRTREAIERMGKSGFSPTFESAAAWLAERVVSVMPTQVENALAFLRALAERGVAAPGPGVVNAALRFTPRDPGVEGAWATAIRIHRATAAMESAISNARTKLAAAVTQLDTIPIPTRRRAPRV